MCFYLAGWILKKKDVRERGISCRKISFFLCIKHSLFLRTYGTIVESKQNSKEESGMSTINSINNSQECLVSTLVRLRESSKDAVVSADSDISDPYMGYMHVDRPVQERFVSVLEKTYNTDHAELILLCGSVGDGKSHTLFYCKQKYPQMMKKFYVHNDSTDSLYVSKPASYTLKKIIEDFADDKLEESKKKVILAINLGTLSNFLDADTDNKFSRLRRYVENSAIFDEKNSKDSSEINEDKKYFHSVNFADYHLYELTKSGATSEYIKGLLKKITCKDKDNIFYKAYCDTCKNCEGYDKCPVCANYKLLSDQKIQEGIIQVLIESIVKNKLIISTRALLNMIYELLVNEKVWDRGSWEPRKIPDKITGVEYYESLLPNVLFEKRNTSEVLAAMSNVDPMRIRNENVDDFVVYYENMQDVAEVFYKDLKECDFLLERVKGTDFFNSNAHREKNAVLKLFIRTLWLLGRRRDLLPEDENYVEYMQALYAWNKGDQEELKDFYNNVKDGIRCWNGDAEKDEMQLLGGNPRSRYHLVQELKIRTVKKAVSVSTEDTLYSFKDELNITYKVGRSSECVQLEVDFTLYALLKDVLKGYVPGINDKRINVKCTEFINQISRGGSKMEELSIRDMSQKKMKKYSIFYDDSGYSFEVR